MPSPNLHQFSFTSLLVVLTSSGLVCGMGVAGGWPWFLFGSILLGGLVLLWFGFRWAIYGTGYWPRGWVGRLLFATMLVLVPAAVLLLAKTFGVGVEKQPTWYRPFGAIPASVPAATFAVNTMSRLSPLQTFD